MSNVNSPRSHRREVGSARGKGSPTGAYDASPGLWPAQKRCEGVVKKTLYNVQGPSLVPGTEKRRDKKNLYKNIKTIFWKFPGVLSFTGPKALRGRQAWVGIAGSSSECCF